MLNYDLHTHSDYSDGKGTLHGNIHAAELSGTHAALYTAPSYDQQDEAAVGIGSPEIEIAEGSGRFGNALEFKKKNTFAVFYRAEDNVAFSESDWSGTVSFWLSLEPGEDLEPGFCDPIQPGES